MAETICTHCKHHRIEIGKPQRFDDIVVIDMTGCGCDAGHTQEHDAWCDIFVFGECEFFEVKESEQMGECDCAICFECNGTGTVWYALDGSYLGPHRCDDMDEPTTCPECRGMGVAAYDDCPLHGNDEERE